MISWTDKDVRAVSSQDCELCWLAKKSSRATVLAVLVGFASDGGGGARLVALCAHCARRRNVVICGHAPAADEAA